MHSQRTVVLDEAKLFELLRKTFTCERVVPITSARVC